LLSALKIGMPLAAIAIAPVNRPVRAEIGVSASAG
jgi:hypothetical protein